MPFQKIECAQLSDFVIETDNQVLENAEKNGQEDEAKLNNEENDQDQPINTSENQENVDEDILKEEILEDKSLQEVGNEEHVRPPPLDLAKVSEEIDEYISTLSNACNGHAAQSVTEDSDSEHAPPDLPILVPQFTLLVESTINEYDFGEVPVKWDQLTDEDTESLLGAVDRMVKLLKALSAFSYDCKYARSINSVGRVLQRVMTYLEEEFRDFLEYHKVDEQDNNDHEAISKQSSNQEGDENGETEPDQVTEKISYICGYSEDSMSSLNKLVKLLITGGHEIECYQIYFIARRNDLGEKLQKQEFEKRSLDDVQKINWEALEKDIISWNETMKEFTIYFINEHKLSGAVFKDHPSIAESLFSTLAKGIIIQLFSFPDAVAMTKCATEKLFKYLDVYESLRNFHLKLEELLATEYSQELKYEASLTRGRLGEAIISIFVELEAQIKADSGKNPVPGGAVHPLTRYTMNYLEHACTYKETLEQVFRLHQAMKGSDWDPTGPTKDQPENSCNNVNKQTPFEMQLVNVLELLHDNIDSKSKLYKDYPLSMIFLMNNGRYILQKIKACGAANGSLNDTWCRKRSSCLRQYHQNYQRETWSKLLSVLINHEGLIVKKKVMKPVLKERFKSFNAMFDEIIKTQASWVISDEQLQSELRVSISNMVVPAYRSFMGRFSQTFSPGRQTEKYVKFQPEEVEAIIDELFDGSATSGGKWKM